MESWRSWQSSPSCFPPVLYSASELFWHQFLVASAVMPSLLALWVCKRVESRFILHGALVGIVAALFYLGLAWASRSRCCIGLLMALRSSVGSLEEY